MKMTSNEWEYTNYLQETLDEFGQIKKVTGFTIGEMFMAVDNPKFEKEVKKYQEFMKGQRYE
jgi:hypothetical protein|tara:strand:- start:19630 stop:19815 length:186 start_codon:yes stop_codon:yes gene_type:complete